MEKFLENKLKEEKVFKHNHTKHLLLWAFTLFLCAQGVMAVLPMCGDTVEIITNCTMLTPTMLANCTTYNIITVNGSVARNESNLSLVNDQIYGFTFDLPEGDYLVRLCDGTTREVHALQGDKEMIGLSIIFGLMLFFGLGLTIYFTVIKSPLANLFLFFTVLFMDVIMFIASRMAEDQMQTWASILWTVFYVMLIITFALIVFYIIFFIKRAVKTAQQAKDDKMKDQYGDAWNL